MNRILLIDDDELLAKPLAMFFQQYHFELSHETHPLKAIEYLKTAQFDCIILDVMLPDIDGFEACRRIRAFSQIPIIMLTARGDVMDRVIGLELGADDYLPKPFEPRELVARIQSILKRVVINTVPRPSLLQFSALCIDKSSQQVTLDDKPVELTSAEFRLLYLLASQPQKVFSRDDIMTELNGVDADVFSRAIDILISRLRAKLKPYEFITTLRARGYQFTPPQI